MYKNSRDLVCKRTAINVRNYLTRFVPCFQIAILLTSLSIVSVSAQAKRYKYQKGVMGSPFVLTFYASNDSLADTAAKRVFTRLGELEETLSDYRDGSEINRLSATSGTGKWVKVSPDLFNILLASKKVSETTNGALDVTIGPVVQLWRKATRTKQFPKAKEISDAQSKTGYRFMKLNEDRGLVKLVKKGMRLDVGSLGKGFAADEAMKILRQFNIFSALIDAGGKVLASDPPPSEPYWRINISNGSDSLATIGLKNSSVATSGPTYRYFEHEGKRYSHILNPKTGVGLLTHIRTSVVATDGITADALATVYSILGIKLAKKASVYFPGTRAWMVEKENDKLLSWNEFGNMLVK